jgi:hypothetical protein
VLFRYSRWDGTQSVPEFGADDVLDDIADDILGYGDLRTALQRLMNQGLKPPQGERTPGLRDLLERLRQRRQQRLKDNDLGSAVASRRSSRPSARPSKTGSRAASVGVASTRSIRSRRMRPAACASSRSTTSSMRTRSSSSTSC